MITEVRYGRLESVGKALYKTWDTSVFSLQMLGKMIVGEVSLKNLSRADHDRRLRRTVGAERAGCRTCCFSR